ncbi:hypothetical protein C6401_15070 [Arthrobacter woluwensis]|nr:hypothetical protein C6401_15070 [Arthrobacter woluwensis]
MNRKSPTTAAAPPSSEPSPGVPLPPAAPQGVRPVRSASPWERLTRGAESLRRGIRGVLGADAYEKYLEFHAAHHPDHEPLSEAEFWRDRTDRQDRNPQGRCC